MEEKKRLKVLGWGLLALEVILYIVLIKFVNTITNMDNSVFIGKVIVLILIFTIILSFVILATGMGLVGTINRLKTLK